MSFAYPPRFKGKGPGLVPKVSTQAGKLLKDDGTWATQALELQGEVAGGSIAAATGFDPGDFFYINASGGGFTAGKWAISDGTNWIEVDSIAGLLPAASQAEVNAGTVTGKYVDPATLHGYADPQLAAKSREGRIISDAVTANRRIQLTPGDVGAVGGLPMTILAEFTVPDSVVSAATQYPIWTLQGSLISNNFFSVPWSIGLAIISTDSLLLSARGADATADVRGASVSGFRSTYSGQFVKVSVTLPGNSTSDPVLTINGVAQSLTIGTPTGSAPHWMDSSLVSTLALAGHQAPAGDLPRVLYGIGAMSTDEVAAWHRDGTLPAWMERTGTAVVQTSGTLTIGRRYYIKSFVAGDSFTNIGAGSNATGVSFTATGTTPTTWTNSSQLVPLGLLDKPVVQPALATADQLGRFSRLIVGGLTVPGSDHGNTVTIYGNTSTDGAQLLGGPIVSNANDIVLDLIEQATATGTPTTKMGASAGAETYKASGALSAGLNVFTPVTRKLAGTSVYIGSTDGTKVRTILHGHKASVPAS